MLNRKPLNQNHMKHAIFCQSCSMPMLREDEFGTERDKSLSHEYCIHCYQDGAFTNPFMTLTDMQNHVRHFMDRRHMDPKEIYRAVNIIPELKRWYKPAKA